MEISILKYSAPNGILLSNIYFILISLPLPPPPLLLLLLFTMSASRDLPAGWQVKESKSRPGVMFYINQKTGETQWDCPTEPAPKPAAEQPQVLSFFLS